MGDSRYNSRQRKMRLIQYISVFIQYFFEKKMHLHCNVLLGKTSDLLHQNVHCLYKEEAHIPNIKDPYARKVL